MGLAPYHQSSRYHLLPTALGWWAQRVSEEVVGIVIRPSNAHQTSCPSFDVALVTEYVTKGNEHSMTFSFLTRQCIGGAGELLGAPGTSSFDKPVTVPAVTETGVLEAETTRLFSVRRNNAKLSKYVINTRIVQYPTQIIEFGMPYPPIEFETRPSYIYA